MTSNTLLVDAGRIRAQTDSEASWRYMDNTITVDAAYGNDVTGAREGQPFATVAAALAVAASGGVILLRPGTHTLAAGITIPSGVTIQGVSRPNTVMQLTGAVGATTLITMGANTSVQNLTVNLTSTSHVTLVGVEFPSTTTTTAFLRDVTLTVDNSGAGAGTSSVTGILSSGTGAFTESIYNLSASTVIVNSTDAGTKRGVLVSTANGFHGSTSAIIVNRTGAAAGSYIGVETNNASAEFELHGNHIGGPSGTGTADVSQTLGSLRLAPGTDLMYTNANGLGLGSITAHPSFLFGDTGAVPVGTRILRPGMAGATTANVTVRIDEACVVTHLRVNATVGPGDARVDTFTVMKNNVSTGYSVTLTGAQTSNESLNVSVSFASGDLLSIQSTVVAASTTTEVVVQVDTI